MLLIRLLVIVLAVWLAWRIWRLLATRRGPPPSTAEDMVRCARCALHLPRSSALRHDADWFCSEAHRAEYLERHPNS